MQARDRVMPVRDGAGRLASSEEWNIKALKEDQR